MLNIKKLGLIALVIGVAFGIKNIFYSEPSDVIPNKDITPNTIETPTPPKPIEVEPNNTEKISIYFIGQNSKHEDVYKIVKRNYDKTKDGNKLDFALNELLRGPSTIENAQGIYTEVPKGTKLRAVSKVNGKLYIDLSGDFEQGGGTDSLYKRLYQLIKTVNKNSTENVYLKIEGHEVDVIGGDGIMITQPLTTNSLGE